MKSWAILVPLPLCAAHVGAAACTSHDECSCVPPLLHLRVPPERALDVTRVDLSGAACAGATTTCEQGNGAGGCLVYDFAAGAAGDCHIDVYFGSGTLFSADVDIIHTSGCCQGYYPEPASAGDVDVPGADEAGASG